jgi:outer membrane lipoprotein SlyB
MPKIIQLISLFILSAPATLPAQSAGSSISLEYGTVSAVSEVHAEKKHAGGALIGGIAGAAIADDHRGLGALAGGLIGGGIQGHHSGKKMLQQYSVEMNKGGVVVINTELHDIAVGDCVMVEQGKYANIRRVSSVNCQVDQQPQHHKDAASNCEKAKDELVAANTDEELKMAVTKVRTLCED